MGDDRKWRKNLFVLFGYCDLIKVFVVCLLFGYCDLIKVSLSAT